MSLTCRVIRVSVVILVALAVARVASAADPKAAASDRMKELISGAAAAYTDGDFDKTRGQLIEAITLGRENGLGASSLMAKSYVLMGVLLINEGKDSKTGIRYFAKALEISPAIQVPPSMVTKAVKAAFDKAEDQDGPTPEPDLPAATAAVGKPTAKDAKKEAAAAAAEERQRAAEEKKQAEAERKQAEAEDRQRASREKAEKAQQDKAERQERAEREKEAAKLTSEAAQAKAAEGQARLERDKLQQEKADRDKQLADAKGRIQQLERDYTDRNKALTAANVRLEKLEGEKVERDKALTDAKGRLQQLEKDKADRDKWLADTKGRLEKLEAEKVERDKALADYKVRIQSLEKEKADRDKELASAKEVEKKTHEANDKLEHTLSQVAARDRERHTREEQERREREKALEGPEIPGHIATPIHCTLPDEVPSDTDLYVHCVPKPGLNAKMLALHYRPGGVAVFNTLVLERSRKGWFVGTIPGGKVRGKMLQYYVEARDGKDGLTAANGKPGSPNVMTIKSKR